MAANLRKWLKHCPACEGGFTDHYFASFAITVVDEARMSRATELLAALRDERWNDTLQFREFEPLRDALVAHVLRCPGRRLIWLAVLEPFELADSAYIVDYGMVSPESKPKLESIISPDKWFSL